MINHVLAICTGVENLALSIPAYGLDFLENPQAGGNLRKLTIKLCQFRPLGPGPNFYHSCFAQLTHLHLLDDDGHWPTYAGWERLINLTHLALARSGPAAGIPQLMQRLPNIRYVALGQYNTSEDEKYTDASIIYHSVLRPTWGVRVVLFWEIPQHDWERGARGEGDFWDLVEREVERRIEKESGRLDCPRKVFCK